MRRVRTKVRDVWRLPIIRRAATLFVFGRILCAVFVSSGMMSLCLLAAALVDPAKSADTDGIRRIAATSGILVSVMLPLLWAFAPLLGGYLLSAVAGMLETAGGRAASRITEPLLTKTMHADDSGNVFAILEKRLESAAPELRLESYVAKRAFPSMLFALLALLLLAIPLTDSASPGAKLELFKRWLAGAAWNAPVSPLLLKEVFPGNARIQPGKPWIVRVEFNRPLSRGAKAFVRLEPGAGGEAPAELPLIRLRLRSYQAAMPGISGERAYTIHAEDRNGPSFSAKAFKSSQASLKSASYTYAGQTVRIDCDSRQWMVPEGSAVDVMVQAASDSKSVSVSGSGGLSGHLARLPQNGLWRTSMTAWEPGAMSFKWTSADGSEGVSDIFTVDTVKDSPPIVMIDSPKPFKKLSPPLEFKFGAKDDFGLAGASFHLTDMCGYKTASAYESVAGKSYSGTFDMPAFRSRLLLGKIVAVAAEAYDSRMDASCVTDTPVRFHPVCEKSTAELLDSLEIMRLFDEWLKNRRHIEIATDVRKSLQPPEKERKPEPPQKKDTKNSKDEKGEQGDSSGASSQSGQGQSGQGQDGKDGESDSSGQSQGQNSGDGQGQSGQGQSGQGGDQQSGQGNASGSDGNGGGNPQDANGQSSGQGGEKGDSGVQGGSGGGKGLKWDEGRTPDGKGSASGVVDGDEKGKAKKSGIKEGKDSSSTPGEQSGEAGKSPIKPSGINGRDGKGKPDTAEGSVNGGDELHNSDGKDAGGSTKRVSERGSRSGIPEGGAVDKRWIEQEIEKYERTKSSLSAEERRIADEYYRRLKDILKEEERKQ